jgi:predicted nucleotidyltransferase
MNVSTVDDLAQAHRPQQFGLLDRLVDMFASSAAVTHLLVRGSLAVGEADRLSDVDLVVGVEDGRYAALVAAHDALMQTELGSVLPGWRDRIVGDMGGVGFVHLVPWLDRLQQVDLYIAATSRIEDLEARTGARAVLVRGDAQPSGRGAGQTAPDSPPSATELLVEVLIVGYMIRKRIRRNQPFVAFAEMHMLATAAKDLVKTALAPDSHYYGWYRLEEEIGITPIGRACLGDLHAVVAGPAVPTRESLDHSLGLVLAIARRAAPEAVEALRPALDIYWNYLADS